MLILEGFFYTSWFNSTTTTQPLKVVCKMKAQSEYVRVAYTFIARLAPTCMLSRCFVNKISASELSQKFIKSVLLAG